MEKTFSSLAELQAEIDLLKVKNFQQEEVLKETLSSPSAIFSTVKKMFKSGNSQKSLKADLMQSDVATNIARFIIPLFMNGVLFKKSGFITKTIITFLSQKVAKQVNSSAISGIIDKVKGAFKSSRISKKRQVVTKDYGIPADSESF